MISDRKHRIAERYRRSNERRRTQILNEPVFSQIADKLETSRTPTLIFEGNKLIYANPDALRRMDYNYRQLNTFNSLELDTGPSKKRLDEIIAFSRTAELNDFEFNFTMPTLDQKLLYMTPQMHRVTAEGREYWITELKEVTKVDPASATGAVYSWFQRLLRRKVIVMDSPEHVDEPFVHRAISAIAEFKSADAYKEHNVLVTLDDATHIDPKAVKGLREYTRDSTFSDQIFMTTRKPETYHWLRFRHIPADTLYLPKKLPNLIQPSLVLA